MDTRKGDGPMTNKICTQAAPPKNRHPRHPRERLTLEYLVLFSPHYRSHCTFWSGRKRFEKRDASSRSFTSGSRRSRKRRDALVGTATNSESCRKRLELGQIFIHTTLSLYKPCTLLLHYTPVLYIATGI